MASHLLLGSFQTHQLTQHACFCTVAETGEVFNAKDVTGLQQKCVKMLSNIFFLLTLIERTLCSQSTFEHQVRIRKKNKQEKKKKARGILYASA